MPGVSLFPAVPVDEALKIANTIAQHNAGQPMLRVDVFHQLKRAPDSGTSRSLVTASSGYGLTIGGYQAEKLALTELGRRAGIETDRTALVEAVLGVAPFKRFFDEYANKAFPSDVPARSFLASIDVPKDRLDACLDVIRKSGESVGLIQERSGALRVLSRDAAIASMSPDGDSGRQPAQDHATTAADIPSTRAERPAAAGSRTDPSLHIDIQVHISPESSPEQIDQIFASMARHLYPTKQ